MFKYRIIIHQAGMSPRRYGAGQGVAFQSRDGAQKMSDYLHVCARRDGVTVRFEIEPFDWAHPNQSPPMRRQPK